MQSLESLLIECIGEKIKIDRCIAGNPRLIKFPRDKFRPQCNQPRCGKSVFVSFLFLPSKKLNLIVFANIKNGLAFKFSNYDCFRLHGIEGAKKRTKLESKVPRCSRKNSEEHGYVPNC